MRKMSSLDALRTKCTQQLPYYSHWEREVVNCWPSWLTVNQDCNNKWECSGSPPLPFVALALLPRSASNKLQTPFISPRFPCSPLAVLWFPPPTHPRLPQAYFQIANWLLVHRLSVCQWGKPPQPLPLSSFSLPSISLCHLWLSVPLSALIQSLKYIQEHWSLIFQLHICLVSCFLLMFIFFCDLLHVSSLFYPFIFFQLSAGSIDASPWGSAVVHSDAVGVQF